jgi:hypothetical protein
VNLPEPPTNWNIDRLTAERTEAVSAFGFTDRQARFLAEVLIYSGVFVERQYCALADIAHGQKTHDFLRRLVERGYARPIATGALHRGRLFHVHHKHFVRRLQGRLELRGVPAPDVRRRVFEARYFPDKRPIGIQDEENALLDAAPTHLQPLIIIALDASLRRGEHAGRPFECRGDPRTCRQNSLQRTPTVWKT